MTKEIPPPNKVYEIPDIEFCKEDLIKYTVTEEEKEWIYKLTDDEMKMIASLISRGLIHNRCTVIKKTIDDWGFILP